MDSVNKEAIQVRNSILGFAVILTNKLTCQCRGDAICLLLKAWWATLACFSTFGLFSKFEIIFFCMKSSTKILGLRQMIYPPQIATNNRRKLLFLENTLPFGPFNLFQQKKWFERIYNQAWKIKKSKQSILNITLNAKQHSDILNSSIKVSQPFHSNFAELIAWKGHLMDEHLDREPSFH